MSPAVCYAWFTFRNSDNKASDLFPDEFDGLVAGIIARFCDASLCSLILCGRRKTGNEKNIHNENITAII